MPGDASFTGRGRGARSKPPDPLRRPLSLCKSLAPDRPESHLLAPTLISKRFQASPPPRCQYFQGMCNPPPEVSEADVQTREEIAAVQDRAMGDDFR